MWWKKEDRSMVLTFCSSAAMSVNGSLGCKALSQKKNKQITSLESCVFMEVLHRACGTNWERAN